MYKPVSCTCYFLYLYLYIFYLHLSINIIIYLMDMKWNKMNSTFRVTRDLCGTL